MFQKIVAIEPLNLTDTHKQELWKYGKSVVFYTDLPRDNAEIIRRIADGDCVLVSYTTQIDREALKACPSIRYIGMCCSLYAPESANVDIGAASEKGIVVQGVRDYGDEGVAEYVISELVQLLHGFGKHMWRNEPMELSGLPVGVVGMGTTGMLVARSLRFFGAEVSYFSRTRKLELEQEEGYTYLPLDELLSKVDVLCTCLNKNVVLLGQREFKLFGNGKILVNTSIGPSHEIEALKAWLDQPGNYVLGDTGAAIDPSGNLLSHPHALCVGKSSGLTQKAKERLGRKAIDNIKEFLAER